MAGRKCVGRLMEAIDAAHDGNIHMIAATERKPRRSNLADYKAGR